MTVTEILDDEIKNNKTIKLTDNSEIVKECLSQDIQIDSVLHVVSVISNVCEFKRRWELMHDFSKRMNMTDDIKFYIVELAYGDQDYHVTEKNNPCHLQLRTQHALWHKENMINLAINKLLPNDWKAVAWIDADIEFENNDWVINALKVLTKFDIIQLFSKSFDLDHKQVPMNVWKSYAFQHCNGMPFTFERGENYWHSGYAWACTREFYNKINFLYQNAILGSADYIISQCILGNTASANKVLEGYKKNIEQYKENFNNVKVGYIPNIIKHYFHGSKKNRRYLERNEILVKHLFDPMVHLEYDNQGIIIPSKNMSNEFLDDIKTYFFQRNEDEFYDLVNV